MVRSRLAVTSGFSDNVGRRQRGLEAREAEANTVEDMTDSYSLCIIAVTKGNELLLIQLIEINGFLMDPN
jgi:hypothetical protein